MSLQYKIDILNALKEKGYTTYKLRKEKILGESTIQKLRTNQGISWESLGVICGLLKCQPFDLIEYVPDPD